MVSSVFMYTYLIAIVIHPNDEKISACNDSNINLFVVPTALNSVKLRASKRPFCGANFTHLIGMEQNSQVYSVFLLQCFLQR